MADDDNPVRDFICTSCNKVFNNRMALYRHKIFVHEKRKYTCDICSADFTRNEHLERHKTTHHSKSDISGHYCEFCDKTFVRQDVFTKHKLSHARHIALGKELIKRRKRAQSPSLETTCKKFKSTQETNFKKRKHSAVDDTSTKRFRDDSNESDPTPSSSQLHDLPPPDPMFPKSEHLPEMPSYRSLYKEKWSQIRTRYICGKLQDQYNLRMTTLGFAWFRDAVTAIFRKQKTAFKLNFSIASILRNTETEELTYFYSCVNNGRYMEAPELIRNEADLEKFLVRFRQFDFLDAARESRPSSKYIIEVIPNITFYVTRILNHPIGSSIMLPDYVINNRGLVALISDDNGLHTDQKCLFRCLAWHKGGGVNVETHTQHLFQVYLDHRKMVASDFKGIALSELVELEPLFETSFFVYELKQNKDGNVVAELVHRSHRKYEPLYLNLFDAHFSYVSDLSSYTQSFSCRNCGSLWKHVGMLHRHETTCEVGTKQLFPGGVYKPAKTIFEQLEEELDIVVDEKDRYFPYRATYDFEAILAPCDDHAKNSKSVEWTSEHIPVSVSVASNVPGFFQPKCFVSTGDATKLTSDFLNYLQTISEVSYKLLGDKFACVIEQLTLLADTTDDSQTKMKSVARKLLDCFQSYLKELIVVGMNCGAYDLPMIKRYFFPALSDNIKFVVKRDASYLCIKTETLKFVDMSNYLAAGSSYDNFLKAYGNKDSVGKLFFPYEWLTSIDKLQETCLPPHEAFYSSLKDTNITAEQYAYCEQLWELHNMQTMKDFLVLYNNHDVEPFGFALENAFSFYKSKQLDIFKQAISLPGITLHYLFRNLDTATFSLFSEKRKDLYSLFKDNIVGGPSIVFHRYHEADVTLIREVEMLEQNKVPKLCKRVLGLDANALYLSALAKPMPTGFCVHRQAENGFKRDRDLPPGTSFACRDWLAWRAHETDTQIQQKFNGSEKQVGPQRLPVDGFDKANNKVYQFNGCYFHAHDCYLTANKDIVDKDDRRTKTEQNVRYIRSQGYELEEIYECEWLAQKKGNPDIRQLLKENVSLPLEEKFQLTEQEIIEGIQSDKLFGVLECDISVPSHLYQHFSELPPIFKNTDVSPADAGSFMEQFARENLLSDKPRRMLISSMHGEKILLATPVVKWYLEHGLQITKVYQLVQYKPEACFASFAEEVSNARRDGDKDTSSSIVAETMKLIGNASYGKTVTNKERHRDVYYCNDVNASRKVNNSHFRSLDEISDDCFEVSMSKKKIKLDLPLHIGFFVYQMAKLRMLEFYYDFLLKFVDRSDFALCQSDTDSYYMAISAPTLDEVIKPSMKEEYERECHLWFPRTDTPEHKAYDKRTPGLFKEEFSGTGIISLCSKTYFCYSESDAKFSCKGVSRRHTDVSKAKYLDVLTNKVSSQGVNKGFRMVGNAMHTYTQNKDAFSYYYAKRKVLADGVTTTYLDL